MNWAAELLLTDLRHLLPDLGRDGGQISPSIYDTAQVVRLAPPPEGVWPALDWLLSQQRPDGGWGNPAVPRARDLPTLAAVLALNEHSERKSVREAVQEGLAFLRRQAPYWHGPLPQDIPVAVELLIPALLEAARRADLTLPSAPYVELVSLGKRRLELIRRIKPGAGSTAMHSWEAWGTVPEPTLFDNVPSLGHSPAATAAWISAASDNPALADQRELARRYLTQAANATRTGIPGVVPATWPLNRFERLFGVYALMMAGLLDHPGLADIAQTQMDEIAASMRPRGYSFSDDFEPDGDDTAAGVALLKLRGYPVDLGVLRYYERGNHFCTWPEELQVSLSATARSVHAFKLAGAEIDRHANHLVSLQQADGRWDGDKWHCSWLYTTSHVVLALIAAGGHRQRLANALESILAHQHHDGGWGSDGASNPTETAYGVLTLLALGAEPEFADRSAVALERARRMMFSEYRPFDPGDAQCWIGKQIYRPYRVDRAFELSAMLALALGRNNHDR